jgi:hypothetical protein
MTNPLPDPTVLQSTPSTALVVAVALFAGVFVATAVGIVLSLRVMRGYRRTGSTHLLALGTGLLLLVPFPKLVNLGLATFAGATSAQVGIVMAVCRLGGLGTILYAIYAN